MIKIRYSWAIFAAIPPIIVLFFIVYWNPHYGLMDDSLHIFDLLPKIREQGILAATFDYFSSDVLNGFARLTYPPMVWMVYGFGREYYPWLTFIINWIYVVSLSFYVACILSRILSAPRWILFISPFAFFYFHDLFLFPSLQEKNIVLFGSTLIFLCSNSCRLSDTKRIPLILLFALLGGVSKTQFVVFFLPATVLLFWGWKREKNLERFLVPFSFFALITTILGLLAYFGTYNSGRHSPEKALRNLLSIQTLYLSLPVFLSMFWVKAGWKKIGINYFVPGLCLLGFFLVFLPWGIDAYVQGTVLFFIGAALVQFIYFSPFQKVFKTMGYSVLVLAAITVSIYRSNRNFTRLSDLRDTLNFISTKSWQLPIYANCPEGKVSMERFLAHTNNVKNDLYYWLKVEKRADHFLFVGDAALCPLVEGFEGCTSSDLQSGHFAKSFKLVEWKCGS